MTLPHSHIIVLLKLAVGRSKAGKWSPLLCDLFFAQCFSPDVSLQRFSTRPLSSMCVCVCVAVCEFWAMENPQLLCAILQFITIARTRFSKPKSRFPNPWHSEHSSRPRGLNSGSFFTALAQNAFSKNIFQTISKTRCASRPICTCLHNLCKTVETLVQTQHKTE